MSFKIGSLNLANTMAGSNQIAKIMQGANLIWSNFSNILVVGTYNGNSDAVIVFYNTTNGEYFIATTDWCSSMQMFTKDKNSNQIYIVDQNGSLGLYTYDLENEAVSNATWCTGGPVSPSNEYVERNYFTKDGNYIYTANYNGVIKKYQFINSGEINKIAEAGMYSSGYYAQAIVGSSVENLIFFNMDSKTFIKAFDEDLIFVKNGSGGPNSYNAACKNLLLTSDGSVVGLYSSFLWIWNVGFANNASSVAYTLPYANRNDNLIVIDNADNIIYVKDDGCTLVKVNLTGTLIWEHTITSTEGTVMIQKMVIDKSNNILGTWGDTYTGYSTGIYQISSAGIELHKLDLTTEFAAINPVMICRSCSLIDPNKLSQLL